MFVHGTLAISVLALAACGGGDGGTAAVDAPTDSPTVKVKEVTCPATTAVTYTTIFYAFVPSSATITVGQTVKFDNSGSLDHPIGPITGDPLSDPTIAVQPGKTKCFTFLVAGTYHFQCTAHGYLGILTVN